MFHLAKYFAEANKSELGVATSLCNIAQVGICTRATTAAAVGGAAGHQLLGGHLVAISQLVSVLVVGVAGARGVASRGCLFFAQRTGPGGLLPDLGMITRTSDHAGTRLGGPADVGDRLAAYLSSAGNAG